MLSHFSFGLGICCLAFSYNLGFVVFNFKKCRASDSAQTGKISDDDTVVALALFLGLRTAP